jgi:hypothetical protein
MRILSSLPVRNPIELLRFRNAELRTQTTATHKSGCGQGLVVSHPVSLLGMRVEEREPPKHKLFTTSAKDCFCPFRIE